MINIDIDDAVTDSIMEKTLVRDYLSLHEQISNLSAKGDNLKPYEIEDISNWLEIVAAIDTLFDWYLIASEADKIRAMVKRSS